MKNKIILIFMLFFMSQGEGVSSDIAHNDAEKKETLPIKTYSDLERRNVISRLVDQHVPLSMGTEIGKDVWDIYEKDRDYILQKISIRMNKKALTASILLLDTLAKNNDFPHKMSLNDFVAMGAWWASTLSVPYDESPLTLDDYQASFSHWLKERESASKRDVDVYLYDLNKETKYPQPLFTIRQKNLQLPYVSRIGLNSIPVGNDCFGFKTDAGHKASCHFLGVGTNYYLAFDGNEKANAAILYYHDQGHLPKGIADLDIPALRGYINALPSLEKAKADFAFHHLFHELSSDPNKTDLIKTYALKVPIQMYCQQFKGFGNEERRLVQEAIHLKLPLPFPEVSKIPSYWQKKKVEINEREYDVKNIVEFRYAACISHLHEGVLLMKKWLDQSF